MIAHARKPGSRRPPSPLVEARRLVAARLLPPRREGRPASQLPARLAWLAMALLAAGAVAYLAYQAGLLG
jgi:hypothetical protein